MSAFLLLCHKGTKSDLPLSFILLIEKDGIRRFDLATLRYTTGKGVIYGWTACGLEDKKLIGIAVPFLLFNGCHCSGPTPYGTVQGAVSKALSLAGSLQTFEPLEKSKMNHATYYRLSAKVLGSVAPESPLHDSDTDATVSDAISAPVRRGMGI